MVDRNDFEQHSESGKGLAELGFVACRLQEEVEVARCSFCRSCPILETRQIMFLAVQSPGGLGRIPPHFQCCYGGETRDRKARFPVGEGGDSGDCMSIA